jgi:Concanavalin A-like lectin/glucanases superfamily
MANGLFTLKQQLQGAVQYAWTGQKSPAVEYLVVAGGGGGGSGYGSGAGAGGGAGGLLQGAVNITQGITYTVTIGTGGNGGASSACTIGGTGNNSVFGNISALGGGGGRSGSATTYCGGSGGSGGGSVGSCSSPYPVGLPGQGTFGQGNAGGQRIYNGCRAGLDASGGGGAGTVGSAFSTGSRKGGNGGAGVASAISGTITVYAGGGGAGGASACSIGGVGGAGGGGGGHGVSSCRFSSGSPNTGGGGGGQSCNGYSGGNGGSGIVILSYSDVYSAAANTTGNVTVSTSGSGSLSFSGSNYLSNTALNYQAAGNFTIEAWIYPTSTSQFTVLDIGNEATGRITFFVSSGNVSYNVYGSGSVTLSAGTVAQNTWQHIAVVRNGTTITGYLNGVAGSTPSTGVSGTLGNSSGFYILGSPGGGQGNGYITNLRYVNGTALYTNNFTPSSTPLVPVANTSLLLNTVSGAQYIDSSGNNTLLTVTGSPSWISSSPFATGLGYKNRVYTWTSSGSIIF